MEKEFEALKAKFKKHEKFWNGFFYLLMILVTVEAVFTAISIISGFLFVLGKILGLFLGILAIVLAFRFISNRVKDKIDSKEKEDTIVIDEAKSNE